MNMTNIFRPNTNTIAYSAILSSLYLILSYITSYAIGPQIRGIDAHFWRAMLMTILAMRLRVIGGPSLMGVISGFLLLAVPSSTSFLYLHSSILCGITYDLIMKSSYNNSRIKRSIIITSSIISGLVESVSVLIGLFIFGFPFNILLGRLELIGMASPIGIFIYGIGKNVIMSGLGAFTAIFIISRINPKLIKDN